MKISLHQSGKFRIGYTESYYSKLAASGKRSETDRAFSKWDKKPVAQNEIMQALDIHFPLQALSSKRKPEGTKGKKLLVVMPAEKSLGDNDSITVKLLFHRTHPESKPFRASLGQRNLTPVFWVELSSGEYLTLSFQYSKQLPLNISDRETKGFAAMFHDYFQRSGKKAGDKIKNLTIQMYKEGMPPAILNIGNVSVFWETEKHFVINIGTPLL